MKTSQLLRARWAAVGAAIAVSIGAGGVWVTHAASPPSSLVLIEPTRILDSRDGTDLGLPGPFMSPVPQDLQVTGEIPTAHGAAIVVPDGATGVLLNVTPVRADADGFISIRPADAAGIATTSSLNFRAGESNPNAVQVEIPTVGPDAGRIEISYDALGLAGPSTDVLVDIVGYTVTSGVDPGVAAQIARLQEEVDTLQASQPFTVSRRRGFINVGTADQVMVSLEVTNPVQGSVTLISTATTGERDADDEIRCSITRGTAFDIMYTQRWESGGEGKGQHAQLSGVRTYGVSPGTRTYNLVCHHLGSVSEDSALDAMVLTAIFTPAQS